MSPLISVIVPYYRNPQMLEVHLQTWATYPPAVREAMQLIIVDDGSPEPAEPVVRKYMENFWCGIQLYRITKDIPWNRGGARNLGSGAANTLWLLHMDIDHILPPDAASLLVALISKIKADRWFRFPRYRVGAADETRNKDDLPREQKFGKVKPHIDSYLVPKELYDRVGGYDEDYSGCLGGGSPFLKQLEALGKPSLFNDIIHLHVYTRDTVPDASDMTLSRDKAEYMRRRKEKELTMNTKAKNPLRFDWERII